MRRYSTYRHAGTPSGAEVGYVLDADESGNLFERKIRGGETVAAAVLAVDERLKVGSRASNVAVMDRTSPAVTGVAVAQGESDYRFAVSAGAVSDDQHEGEVLLYHVVTNNKQPGTDLSVVGPLLSDPRVGKARVSGDQFAAFSNLGFQGLGLASDPGFATSHVFLFNDLGALQGVADAGEGMALASLVYARDASGNLFTPVVDGEKGAASNVRTADRTPPALSNLSVSTSAGAATVSFGVSDGGDAFLGQETNVYAGLYETAPPSSATAGPPPDAAAAFDPATRRFPGALSNAVVSAAGASSVTFADVKDLGHYAVLAVAADAASNASGVLTAAFRQPDRTPPALSNVAFSQAPFGVAAENPRAYYAALARADVLDNDLDAGHAAALAHVLASPGVADAVLSNAVASEVAEFRQGRQGPLVSAGAARLVSVAPGGSNAAGLALTAYLDEAGDTPPLSQLTVQVRHVLSAVDHSGNAARASAVVDVYHPGALYGAQVSAGDNPLSELKAEWRYTTGTAPSGFRVHVLAVEAGPDPGYSDVLGAPEGPLKKVAVGGATFAAFTGLTSSTTYRFFVCAERADGQPMPDDEAAVLAAVGRTLGIPEGVDLSQLEIVSLDAPALSRAAGSALVEWTTQDAYKLYMHYALRRNDLLQAADLAALSEAGATVKAYTRPRATGNDSYDGAHSASSNLGGLPPGRTVHLYAAAKSLAPTNNLTAVRRLAIAVPPSSPPPHPGEPLDPSGSTDTDLFPSAPSPSPLTTLGPDDVSGAPYAPPGYMRVVGGRQAPARFSFDWGLDDWTATVDYRFVGGDPGGWLLSLLAGAGDQRASAGGAYISPMREVVFAAAAAPDWPTRLLELGRWDAGAAGLFDGGWHTLEWSKDDGGPDGGGRLSLRYDPGLGGPDAPVASFPLWRAHQAGSGGGRGTLLLHARELSYPDQNYLSGARVAVPERVSVRPREARLLPFDPSATSLALDGFELASRPRGGRSVGGAADSTEGNPASFYSKELTGFSWSQQDWRAEFELQAPSPLPGQSPASLASLRDSAAGQELAAFRFAYRGGRVVVEAVRGGAVVSSADPSAFGLVGSAFAAVRVDKTGGRLSLSVLWAGRPLIGGGAAFAGAAATPPSAFDGAMAPLSAPAPSVASPLDIAVAFPEPVFVTQYRVWAHHADPADAPADWVLQGSHDGASWADVDARSDSAPPPTSGLGLTDASPATADVPHGDYAAAAPGFYPRYRMRVTRAGAAGAKVSQVQLVGVGDQRPQRTLIGRGQAYAGATFSESSKFNDLGASYAFDGMMREATHSLAVGGEHWIQVSFPAEHRVTAYRLWACTSDTDKDAPIDWTLEGSVGDGPWTVVDRRVNSEPPDTSRLGLTSDSRVTLAVPHGLYYVATPGYYSRYRLRSTKTGSTILRVAEMELLEGEGPAEALSLDLAPLGRSPDHRSVRLFSERAAPVLDAGGGFVPDAYVRGRFRNARASLVPRPRPRLSGLAAGEADLDGRRALTWSVDQTALEVLVAVLTGEAPPGGPDFVGAVVVPFSEANINGLGMHRLAGLDFTQSGEYHVYAAARNAEYALSDAASLAIRGSPDGPVVLSVALRDVAYFSARVQVAFGPTVAGGRVGWTAGPVPGAAGKGFVDRLDPSSRAELTVANGVWTALATGLTNGTTYTFVAYGEDAQGRPTGLARAAATTLPAFLTAARAAPGASDPATSVDLSWGFALDGPGGYTVHAARYDARRSPPPGKEEVVSRSAAQKLTSIGALRVTADGLLPGTAYHFYLYAARENTAVIDRVLEVAASTALPGGAPGYVDPVVASLAVHLPLDGSLRDAADPNGARFGFKAGEGGLSYSPVARAVPGGAPPPPGGAPEPPAGLWTRFGVGVGADVAPADDGAWTLSLSLRPDPTAPAAAAQTVASLLDAAGDSVTASLLEGGRFVVAAARASDSFEFVVPALSNARLLHGAWSELTVAHSGGDPATLSVFVDGAYQTSGGITPFRPARAFAGLLAAGPPASPAYSLPYQGFVDEVRFFSARLVGADAAAVAARYAADPGSLLCVRVPFDEPNRAGMNVAPALAAPPGPIAPGAVLPVDLVEAPSATPGPAGDCVAFAKPVLSGGTAASPGAGRGLALPADLLTPAVRPSDAAAAGGRSASPGVSLTFWARPSGQTCPLLAGPSDGTAGAPEALPGARVGAVYDEAGQKLTLSTVAADGNTDYIEFKLRRSIGGPAAWAMFAASVEETGRWRAWSYAPDDKGLVEASESTLPPDRDGAARRFPASPVRARTSSLAVPEGAAVDELRVYSAALSREQVAAAVAAQARGLAPPERPVLSGLRATDVGASGCALRYDEMLGATVYAVVTPRPAGGVLPRDVWYENPDALSAPGSGTDAYIPVTGLSDDTEYHAYAVAVSGGVPSDVARATFRTLATAQESPPEFDAREHASFSGRKGGLPAAPADLLVHDEGLDGPALDACHPGPFGPGAAVSFSLSNYPGGPADDLAYELPYGGTGSGFLWSSTDWSLGFRFRTTDPVSRSSGDVALVSLLTTGGDAEPLVAIRKSDGSVLLRAADGQLTAHGARDIAYDGAWHSVAVSKYHGDASAEISLDGAKIGDAYPQSFSRENASAGHTAVRICSADPSACPSLRLDPSVSFRWSPPPRGLPFFLPTADTRPFSVGVDVQGAAVPGREGKVLDTAGAQGAFYAMEFPGFNWAARDFVVQADVRARSPGALFNASGSPVPFLALRSSAEPNPVVVPLDVQPSGTWKLGAKEWDAGGSGLYDGDWHTVVVRKTTQDSRLRVYLAGEGNGGDLLVLDGPYNGLLSARDASYASALLFSGVDEPLLDEGAVKPGQSLALYADRIKIQKQPLVAPDLADFKAETAENSGQIRVTFTARSGVADVAVALSPCPLSDGDLAAFAADPTRDVFGSGRHRVVAADVATKTVTLPAPTAGNRYFAYAAPMNRQRDVGTVRTADALSKPNTPGGANPPLFSGPTLSAAGFDSVTLGWTYNNVDKVLLARRPDRFSPSNSDAGDIDSSPYTTSIGAGADGGVLTSHTVSGLAPGTEYFFHAYGGKRSFNDYDVGAPLAARTWNSYLSSLSAETAPPLRWTARGDPGRLLFLVTASPAPPSLDRLLALEAAAAPRVYSLLPGGATQGTLEPAFLPRDGRTRYAHAFGVKEGADALDRALDPVTSALPAPRAPAGAGLAAFLLAEFAFQSLDNGKHPNLARGDLPGLPFPRDKEPILAAPPDLARDGVLPPAVPGVASASAYLPRGARALRVADAVGDAGVAFEFYSDPLDSWTLSCWFLGRTYYAGEQLLLAARDGFGGLIAGVGFDRDGAIFLALGAGVAEHKVYPQRPAPRWGYFDNDRWHHAALSRSASAGGSTELFVDGDGPFAAETSSTALPLRHVVFGAKSAADADAGAWFRGYLADARAYSASLGRRDDAAYLYSFCAAQDPDPAASLATELLFGDPAAPWHNSAPPRPGAASAPPALVLGGSDLDIRPDIHGPRSDDGSPSFALRRADTAASVFATHPASLPTAAQGAAVGFTVRLFERGPPPSGHLAASGPGLLGVSRGADGMVSVSVPAADGSHAASIAPAGGDAPAADEWAQTAVVVVYSPPGSAGVLLYRGPYLAGRAALPLPPGAAPPSHVSLALSHDAVHAVSRVALHVAPLSPAAVARLAAAPRHAPAEIARPQPDTAAPPLAAALPGSSGSRLELAWSFPGTAGDGTKVLVVASDRPDAPSAPDVAARSDPASRAYHAASNAGARGLFGPAIEGGADASLVRSGAYARVVGLPSLRYGKEYRFAAACYDERTGAVSRVARASAATLHDVASPPYEPHRRGAYPGVLRTVGPAPPLLFDPAISRAVSLGPSRATLAPDGFGWDAGQWEFRARVRAAAPPQGVALRGSHVLLAGLLAGAQDYGDALPLVEIDWEAGVARLPGGGSAGLGPAADGLWVDVGVSKPASGSPRLLLDGAHVASFALPPLAQGAAAAGLLVSAASPTLLDPVLVFSHGGQGGNEPDDAPVVAPGIPAHLDAPARGFRVPVDLGWSVDRVLVARTQSLPLVGYPDEEAADWTAANVVSVPRADAVASRSVDVSGLAHGAYYLALAAQNSPARGGEYSEPRVLAPLATSGVSLHLLPSAGPAYLGTDVWDFVVTEKSAGVQNNRTVAITEVAWDRGPRPEASAASTARVFAGRLEALFDGEAASGGLNTRAQWLQHDYAVGDTLFTIKTPAAPGRVLWSVSYLRAGYSPGLRILRNGTEVYRDPEGVAGDGTDQLAVQYQTADGPVGAPFRYFDANADAGGWTAGGGFYSIASVGLDSNAGLGGLAALAGPPPLLPPGFSAADAGALPVRFALDAGRFSSASLSNLQPGERYELYSFGESATAGAGAGLSRVAGLVHRRAVLPPAVWVDASHAVAAASNATDVVVGQLRKVVVPSLGQRTPDGASVLPRYRATLVSFTSSIQLGKDPVATLLGLAARTDLGTPGQSAQGPVP